MGSVQILMGLGGRETKRVPSDALWIVPNDWHCAELRAHVAEVLTFPQLALRLCPSGTSAKLLPDSQQRLLLEEAMRQLAAEHRLPTFHAVLARPGFVTVAFSFLSELKGLGADPQKFVEHAGQVAEHIGVTGLRPSDRELQAIYERFQNLLRKLHRHDRAATYELALRNVGKAKLPWDRIVLSGFAQWTPPQLDLIERLARIVDSIWIDLPGDDQDCELFSTTSRTLGYLNQRFPSADFDSVEPLLAAPAGLRHLAQQLFREHPKTSENAAGLSLIEAPGLIGEVKLVARAVKQQIGAGVKPESILVSARRLTNYVDLLVELFDEYAIPIAIEGQRPLLRQPVAATLLKAARLPLDDWPFAETAALLRSNFVQPNWPELAGDPERLLDAEILLRQLGEPRGKEAFLKSATKWAEDPPLPLEDEAAEQPIRRRRHELAIKCLPVLHRFFSAWDGLPNRAPPKQFVEWLEALGENLGLLTGLDAGESRAIGQFFDELKSWSEQLTNLESSSRLFSLAEFLDVATALAGSNGLPIAEQETHGVRIVPAELAAGLSYDHLYLLGLGERGFPDLSDAPNLIPESIRQIYHGVGLDLDVAAERLPREMLLFYRMVTDARQTVTLSYAAVDEKGQEQLPGSFLRAVCALFEDGAITTTKRKMLLEGLGTDKPLSPSEKRVRWAKDENANVTLDPPLVEHLTAAKRMTTQRFERDRFGRYDGRLENSAALNAVAARFGPEREFAPTALEDYVACPFKFFMKHGLRLTALTEPNEEIEMFRRGAVIHRAMARLHRRVQDDIATATAELAGELDVAVAEDADKSSSATTKMLWQLEGERLKRIVQRYAGQWDKFRKHYDDVGPPRPHLIEADFGTNEEYPALVLETGKEVIRIRGRIDRIDLVDLADGSMAFWVIDYKTGRGTYAATEVQRLEVLQLPIYALAAERWLSEEQPARPLGLLYWLPVGKGSKFALPGKPLAWIEADGWPEHRQRLIDWLGQLATNIRAGQFPLAPRSEHCTNTCDFGTVCRISQSRGVTKDWVLELPVIEVAHDD